jgi:outer membrane protein OmpA-like peptidoglycan-associated protein
MINAGLNARWYASKYVTSQKPKWLGYLDGGIGIALTDGKTVHTAHKTIIDAVPTSAPYEHEFTATTPVVGFGGGFQIKLYKRLSLDFGTKFNFALGDELDGLHGDTDIDTKYQTGGKNPWNTKNDSYWMNYAGVSIDFAKEVENSLSKKWGIGELLAYNEGGNNVVPEDDNSVKTDTIIKVIRDTVYIEKPNTTREVVSVDHSLVAFTPVYFDYDKSNVKADQQESIKNVAEYMKKYPEVLVNLNAHTDARGSDQYNLKLSERRALAVKKELIEKYGVTESRIYYFPLGKSQLKYNSHDLNRRVDFNLKTEGE